MDPVAAVVAAENGRVLFLGKITDVARKTQAGFVRGDLFLTEIVSTGNSQDDEKDDKQAASPRVCKLHFQNEFLACEVDGSPTALVPDLISVLESDTGRAIGTEELKYGLRATVIVIPCSPLLCTPQALAVVGPRAFGINMDFADGQVGVYKEPVSVCVGRAGAKL